MDIEKDGANESEEDVKHEEGSDDGEVNEEA